jgi:hypothetical protein
MSKLRKKFSVKEWQDCCGKLCDDCKIAKAYKDNFGKTEGKKKLKKDIKKFN